MPAQRHFPLADEQGVFREGNPSSTGGNQLLGLVVLDSGAVVQVGTPSLAVDMTARDVAWGRTKVDYAPPLSPPAIPMPHTEQGRQERPPTQVLVDDQGAVYTPTYWNHRDGQEVNVQERDGGVNTHYAWDAVVTYAGERLNRNIRSGTQQVTVWDFDWQVTFAPYNSLPHTATPRGLHAGDTEYVAVSTPTEWSGGSAYRDVNYQLLKLGGKLYEVTLQQAHHTGVWLVGDWELGRDTWEDTHTIDVTRVIKKDIREGETTPWRSCVDAWLTIASLEQYVTSRPWPPSGTEGQALRKKSMYGQPYISAYLYGWPTDPPDPPVLTLRDIETAPVPNLTADPVVRYTALDGQVEVRGQRRADVADLGDGESLDTLTAFGHDLVGGSWGALRLPAVQDEAGDWQPGGVLVLHERGPTVTVVQPDGQVRTLHRLLFETEVLHCAPGAFKRFWSVGLLLHHWPPDRVWCQCEAGGQGEYRAVVPHDAWRDSYKLLPPAPLDGLPTFDHWGWRGRPGRRPRALPPTAPVAPLGLTLGDVARVVQHDELLPRDLPPLHPPISATQGGQDVLRRVGKRVPYPPLTIPDEQDDRTAITGEFSVTFAPYDLPSELDTPAPAPPGDPGKSYEPPPLPLEDAERYATLYLRLKNPGPTIDVQGETLPLTRLGHNAGVRGGWHPYIVSVPYLDTYTIRTAGRCSLVARHVGVTLPDQGGEAS